MTTRFYFHGTEAPAVSPAFDPAWTSTAGAIRRKLLTAKTSGDTVTTHNTSGISVGQTQLICQFVSEPMAAGLLFVEGSSTDWLSYGHMKESATDDNCRTALAIAICSQDGNTIRVRMYAPNNAGVEGSGSEWNQPALRALNIISTSNASGFIPGGNYTTQSGDRLVVEIGFTGTSGSVTPNGTMRIGSDSAQSDCPQNETDTTSAVPWFEWASGTVSFPVPPSGGAPVRMGWRPPPAVGFTIDGRPIEAFDWQAEAATDHGDRTLTGRVRKDVGAEQGAPIVIWRGPGDALWSGEIVADPKVEDDWLSFRAEGHARKLEQDRTRMLYRADGAEGWTDSDADPHGYGAQFEGYDRNATRGKLQWAFGDGDTAFANGDDAGFVFWAEGALITGFTAVQSSANALGAFDFIYRFATGPDGSRTLDGTFAIGTGPTSRSATLTTPSDLLEFAVNANSGTTQAARRRVWLNGIKVYGRTDDDDFSASQVVEDAASLVGLATNVIPNGLPVLPLDWTDGLASLLTYMAELTDWRWMAKHDGVHFGPWGRIWEAATVAGARPGWEPQERANVFVQPWRTVAGRLREATATADPDPFPGETRAVFGDVLEDPQPNNDLASAIAAARVAWESTPRMTGSVELSQVFYQGTPRSPYDVNAGDQLLITDLPLGPQRVTGVTYRPGGSVTVQVGEDFNTTALLKELDEERPRRSRKAKSRRSVKRAGRAA